MNNDQAPGDPNSSADPTFAADRSSYFRSETCKPLAQTAGHWRSLISKRNLSTDSLKLQISSHSFDEPVKAVEQVKPVEIAEDEKVIRLAAMKCLCCGAGLQVDPDASVLACAHCGTNHLVERKGGVLSLTPIVEAIQRVQRGTDRTAAELAKPRLERELRQALAERERLLNPPVQPSGAPQGIAAVGAGVMWVLFIYSLWAWRWWWCVLLLFAAAVFSAGAEQTATSVKANTDAIDQTIARIRRQLEATRKVLDAEIM